MKRKHYYESVELDDLHLKEIPDNIAMYACHGSYLVDHNRLTSLKNAATFVKGNFNCSFNKLTSLVGGPEEVQGHYVCSNNNITSLEGVAKIIGGYLYCQVNRLTSLDGLPKLKSGASLLIGSNKISSIDGYGLENIQFNSFYCESNNITSLKGGPSFVQGTYDCSGNPITSFVGAPTFVGGDFFAGELRNLKDLIGFPKTVENNLYMDRIDLMRLFPKHQDEYELRMIMSQICKVRGRIHI